MKKPILITICCASLMLVTPLVGVAQENTVGNNLTEQPNDVEGLVAQIRIVIDEILEKYGHIPIISSLCNVIVNSLDSVGLILFCISLLIIAIPLELLFDIIWRITGEIPSVVGGLLLIIYSMYDLECSPSFSLYDWFSSFQYLYTMLETKDCPCLEN